MTREEKFMIIKTECEALNGNCSECLLEPHTCRSMACSDIDDNFKKLFDKDIAKPKPSLIKDLIFRKYTLTLTEENRYADGIEVRLPPKSVSRTICYSHSLSSTLFYAEKDAALRGIFKLMMDSVGIKPGTKL